MLKEIKKKNFATTFFKHKILNFFLFLIIHNGYWIEWDTINFIKL